MPSASYWRLTTQGSLPGESAANCHYLGHPWKEALPALDSQRLASRDYSPFSQALTGIINPQSYQSHWP